MEQRSQRPGEDSHEYFFDKVRLCKALGFGISETKAQIAIGLWSREISATLMSQEFLTLDDVLKRIIDMETLEAARKQRISGRREPHLGSIRREELAGSSSSSSGTMSAFVAMKKATSQRIVR